MLFMIAAAFYVYACLVLVAYKRLEVCHARYMCVLPRCAAHAASPALLLPWQGNCLARLAWCIIVHAQHAAMHALVWLPTALCVCCAAYSTLPDCGSYVAHYQCGSLSQCTVCSVTESRISTASYNGCALKVAATKHGPCLAVTRCRMCNCHVNRPCGRCLHSKEDDYHCFALSSWGSCTIIVCQPLYVNKLRAVELHWQCAAAG